MTQRLLAIFAHPDDEAFGTGATLAHYGRNGTRVGLVCATNGDVGEIAEGVAATPETLWQVRQEELRCAAGSLGVRDLIFLNYRDSGMAGTDQNGDPRAFINAPEDEVVGRLVGVLRDLKPQVVITFDPTGGYGHPDHIAIHRHTVAAFEAAADTSRYPDAGEPWQAQRLFYMAFPGEFWKQIRDELAAAGQDVSQWEGDADDSSDQAEAPVHVSMALPDTVDAKLAALECHASQFGPDNMFRKLPVAVMRDLLSHEYYTLARPEPATGETLSDLFAGLDCA
ncbi:MAG: PIG-L family deacetylase [Caldilineales bacterium]